MRRLRARPTPVLLAALIVLTAAAGFAIALRQPEPTTAAIVLLSAVAACAALALGPLVHPAVPLVAGLMLSVFSGNWDNLGVPIGVDRPLVAYGILLALLRLLPDARDRWQLRLSPVHGLMLGVAVLGVGSAIVAGTFTEPVAAFALTERLGISGFLLFLVAPRVFASQRARDGLLVGFLVLGGYLGLTALFETLGLRQLVVPPYINDPSVGIHFERARGPLVEAGQFGLALFTCAVGAAIAYTRWTHRAVRVACAGVLLLCLVGVTFTLTRQAWLGAALGSIVAMALSPALRKLLIPSVIAGAVLVAAALAVVPGLDDAVTDRADSDLPVYDRLNSNRAAVEMARDRPLTGFGWFTFRDSSLPFLEQHPDYELRSVPIAHNVFLGFAAELGLIVTGLWVLILLIVVGTAIAGRAPPELEPWRIGVVAAATNWLVIANLAPSGSAFANNMLWLLPGIVWGGLARHAVVERIGQLRRRRGQPFAPLAGGRCIRLLIALAAVGGAAGLALGHTRAPTYQASADSSVGGVLERSYELAFIDVGFRRWASTYGRVGLADSVMGPAARELGTTPVELRERTVVTPLLDEPTVAVRVRAPTPELAVRGATAVRRSLESAVRRVVLQESVLDRLRRDYANANRQEARSLRRVEEVSEQVADLGLPTEALTPARVAPLNRAVAGSQSATLRRIGIGSRYASMASVDRGVLELRSLGPAVLDRDDRWSVAGQWACAGALAGLLLGGWLGLFGRRSVRPHGRTGRR